MTCRAFADFMGGYLDGELPPETLQAFEHHLTLCPTCVAYLANYRATIMAGKRAFAVPDDEELPASVPEELIQAILTIRRGPMGRQG